MTQFNHLIKTIMKPTNHTHGRWPGDTHLTILRFKKSGLPYASKDILDSSIKKPE